MAIRVLATGKGCWAALALLVLGGVAAAQSPPTHPLHAGAMPPGAIGRQRLVRGGPLCGYVQAVQVKLPEGVLGSLAVDGHFAEPTPGPQLAGLQIGYVYRLRVTELLNRPGEAVYPTIELIDRLYPPPGKELEFPIPIELTAEELELAAQGSFVTRVIYVEDPLNALPVAQDPDEHQWYEAATDEDPLQAADRLGRPIAILRIGGRAPSQGVEDPAFLFGCPPVQMFEQPTPTY